MSNSNVSKDFMLVHFPSAKDYSVIEDAAKKFLNAKKIKVEYPDRWHTGDILYRGIYIYFIL